MVEMRDDLTFDDFVSITKALRILRPDLKGHVCVGVEKPQNHDLSVVFHLMPLDYVDEQEPFIMMVSADLILERFGGSGNVAERNLRTL
jgi:hypothetical protein